MSNTIHTASSESDNLRMTYSKNSDGRKKAGNHYGQCVTLSACLLVTVEIIHGGTARLS